MNLHSYILYDNTQLVIIFVNKLNKNELHFKIVVEVYKFRKFKYINKY